MRKNDRWATAMARRTIVGRKNLPVAVPTATQLADLLVRQVFDHIEQARIRAPNLLARVRTRHGDVLLPLAINQFIKALAQQPLGVAREQLVPFRTPHDFDHVPAGAAKHGLQFLDDLAITAYGPIESLQVTVDHEDEVVELFTSGHRERAERLGLIGFAITHEGPDTL